MYQRPIKGYKADGTAGARLFDYIRDDEGKEIIKQKIGNHVRILPVRELEEQLREAREQEDIQ